MQYELKLKPIQVQKLSTSILARTVETLTGTGRQLMFILTG